MHEYIVSMAREQGLPETAIEGVFRVNSDDLGRMLAVEREACAQLCDRMEWPGRSDEAMAKNEAASCCADAIRSRTGELG